MADDFLNIIEQMCQQMADNLNEIALKVIRENPGLTVAQKVTRPFSPEEKLRRLRNPLTLDDYGLSITEEELNSFPEGREFLKEFKEKYSPVV